MTSILYLHEQAQVSGGEHSLLLLWQHLDPRRFRPVLLAPGDGPFLERARRLGVATHELAFPRLRGLLGPKGRRCLAAARRLARQEGVRIVHGNSPLTNLVAWWVARRSPRRVVWHERTLPQAHEWDVDRWLRRLPDRIICNSLAVARRFGGPDGQVVVVLNGVPLDRFRPGPWGAAVRRQLGLGARDVAVGIVGNFSSVKRHELFLQAAAVLAPQVPHAHFVVVGGEVFPGNRGRGAALRAECRRLGLEGRVQFLEGREDMPAVMNALDVLVSAAEREACSRSILEAIASGVPVVAADGGGNPELVATGETGLLFPPGDAAALAAALRELMGDPSRRKAMGAAGRARAEAAFSIETQARRIEAVYDGLLAQG